MPYQKRNENDKNTTFENKTFEKQKKSKSVSKHKVALFTLNSPH